MAFLSPQVTKVVSREVSLAALEDPCSRLGPGLLDWEEKSGAVACLGRRNVPAPGS